MGQASGKSSSKRKTGQKSAGSAATMIDRLIEYLIDVVVEKDKIKSIFDKVNRVKKLPVGEREHALFPVYIELERFITTHNPPVVRERYTVESLRKEIKDTFGVKGFSPRLNAWLGISGIERIIFSEIILEALIEKLIAAIKPSRVQSVIDETTRGQQIEGIQVKKDGTVDFSASERKIFSVSKPWFGLISINYRNLISALCWRVRDELGEEKAGKLLEDAYNSVMEKYGYLPEARSVIGVMPDDFLTEERKLDVLADCYKELTNGVSRVLFRGGIKTLKRDVSASLTSILKGVKFASDGSLDFSALQKNLDAVKEDKEGKLIESFSKLISVIHRSARKELGDETAGKILEDAYKSVMEKYGALPITSQVLQVIPEGVLGAEKLEAKAKEELERGIKRMDMLRGEFATVAAHELRGPLVPLITYTELLLKDKKHKLTPEQKKKLELILASAHREKELVDDVMDMTKLESGAMRFDMQEIQVGDIVKEAVVGQRAAAEEKKIFLRAKVPKGLPLAYGDPKRLTQVITNLIRNAVRFTDKGGITVSASRGDGQVIVEVQDTGAGIAEEDLQKLFRKFSQVGPRREGGTGLGLAISKAIVEAHGGRIWVKSKLGQGTTFSFSLPVQKR
jgi:signal transduction histidine kinase